MQCVGPTRRAYGCIIEECLGAAKRTPDPERGHKELSQL